MASPRKARISQIENLLGNEKLVWFGTRGTDSHALLQLEQFSEVYSIIAPLGSVAVQKEVCLEALTKRRVDLDKYSIDYDNSDAAHELLDSLYHALDEPAWMAMYRPGAFFAPLYFPHCEHVKYLGQFHERQAPFEHKPWVEWELKQWGVRVAPWRYFGDGDLKVVQGWLRQDPAVLRSSRSDGGAGLALVRTPEDVSRLWPAHSDHFLGIAPYMMPHIPMNINAVVFRSGEVSLHAPSLQLIGLPNFTRRTFGYCGNDFAAVRDLPVKALDQLEEIVRKAGAWLSSMGYVGAFGVDAMLWRDEVYLCEINPRFQGSSHLASHLDVLLDRADMFLEHIAAFLGLAAPAAVPLRELAAAQRKMAHVVCHNVSGAGAVRSGCDILPETPVVCQLLPDAGVEIDPEAILFRAVVPEAVTTDGTSLLPRWRQEIEELTTALFVPATTASSTRSEQ